MTLYKKKMMFMFRKIYRLKEVLYFLNPKNHWRLVKYHTKSRIKQRGQRCMVILGHYSMFTECCIILRTKTVDNVDPRAMYQIEITRYVHIEKLFMFCIIIHSVCWPFIEVLTFALH